MAKDSTSGPTRLWVDQPTQGADRNRDIADRTDPATDDVLLSSLEVGIAVAPQRHVHRRHRHGLDRPPDEQVGLLSDREQTRCLLAE